MTAKCLIRDGGNARDRRVGDAVLQEINPHTQPQEEVVLQYELMRKKWQLKTKHFLRMSGVTNLGLIFSLLPGRRWRPERQLGLAWLEEPRVEERRYKFNSTRGPTAGLVVGPGSLLSLSNGRDQVVTGRG